MRLLSVNLGHREYVPCTDHPEGVTGIDKQPVEGPVRVAAPGPKGTAGSGVAGDEVCSLPHHGGDDQAVHALTREDQAVHALTREDLDDWERELGRPPANGGFGGFGGFGENLTTSGLDLSGALIGERWRIGPDLVLEVTCGRLPCRTFQGHMGEKQWVKRFTTKGAPGAYLRVIEPGEIRAGDAVEIIHRPDHDVTMALSVPGGDDGPDAAAATAGGRRGAAPAVAGGSAQVRREARLLTIRHRTPANARTHTR